MAYTMEEIQEAERQKALAMTEDEFVAYRRKYIMKTWAEGTDPEWLRGYDGNQRIAYRNYRRVTAKQDAPQ